MPPAGFEPVIPAGERLQTHALDRSATGMGDIDKLAKKKTVPSISLITTGYDALLWRTLNVNYNLIFKYCDNVVCNVSYQLIYNLEKHK